MARQHLTVPATAAEYDALYRDLSPGYNVYWNGFGDPPSLTYRADFDDMEYNRRRQAERKLVKVRLMGGNLGWICREDLELFACLYQKPLTKPSERQMALLELIEREGPMSIQMMKESTGMLVKEITPALHRLQEAFLIYEDQNEGQDDRGWYRFAEMFPDVDLMKYPKTDALKILIKRFAYRHVMFSFDIIKSFYKLPEKVIKQAWVELLREMVMYDENGNFIFENDYKLLETYSGEPSKFVYALHRNDFLVKSNEYWLKEKYQHSYPDTLYYLLIDGAFHGAVVGKFRYSPEVSDVILDLPAEEAQRRKGEIVEAIKRLSGKEPERFQGEEVL